MLLTDRRATVQLYFELYYLISSPFILVILVILVMLIRIISLSSYFCESQLTYLYKRTLFWDNSLSVTAGTGKRYPLASGLEKVFHQVKWVIREVEICTGKVDRWFISNLLINLCRSLPCKLRLISFYFESIITKLTTLSVRKKRSENLLVGTECLQITDVQPQNMIPVNHNEIKAKSLYGNNIARTINNRRYLWGRGFVVPIKGRDLNIGTFFIYRSYSTKNESEAPSWNDTKVAKRLKTLWNGNLNNPNFVNEGLWKLLADINLWTAAYIKLSKSKGSNTPSFDGYLIDGITLRKLENIRDEIIEGKYEFSTTKRIYIPKNNGKLRPLGIPSFKDRIVQEVVRVILEIIYEPIFSNHSHGFRPGRSCHTALRHVKQLSNGFNWVIEGDIKSFFDNIDHKILLKLLNKKIDDPKFISLINKMLKTKVKEEGSKETVSFIGSPQGSIISPLFSNILLHEFDMFMEQYILNYNKGKGRKINPEYDKLWKKYGIKAARKVSYHKYDDSSYRRMHYVRYADDFIITLIGPKKEAFDIKNKCTEFFKELNLTLSDDKTLLSNPKDRPIPFLGYIIQKSPKQKYFYSRIYSGKIKKVSAIRGGQVYLKADISKVKARLCERNFCNKNGYPIPNFKYLSLPQYDAITKVSYILRSLASYYILARNFRDFMSRINYILRYSTAKLFAAKFRIRSIAKVFAIAGKDLGRPINIKQLKSKKAVIGQTEDNIINYLKTIGVAESKFKKKQVTVRLPYTTFKDILKPDLAPLKKNFNSKFEDVIYSKSISSIKDPLNTLN